ncbi:MAG: DegV family protein [Lachnospiraceae bacterium]|nr:DegV family protein [Lachnospiraceae bacterium]MDY5741750.1 DegV family protein [Lachnospiraceae bacterium]
MANIRIVTDSTADLMPEVREKYHISVIPLCVQLGEDSFFDGETITPDEIYQWSDQHKLTPKTAAVLPGKALEVIEPMVEAGDDIIFIGISEELSATCQVLRLLAQQLHYDRLFVIDSRNLCFGVGLQAIWAADLAAQGKPAEEIVNIVGERQDRIRTSFIIDTLTYLARGGRCSGATALVANALRLKPTIIVGNGGMTVGKKYRGKGVSVYQKYVGDMREALLNASPEMIGIYYSGGCEEAFEQIQRDIRELGYFETIITGRAGSVISCHCGPGTLGIIYLEK